MKTGKIGMVGHRPKVLIKPAKGNSLLTPEQKAQLRLEKRLKAEKDARKTAD